MRRYIAGRGSDRFYGDRPPYVRISLDNLKHTTYHP
jgi:hypothetical protein